MGVSTPRFYVAKRDSGGVSCAVGEIPTSRANNAREMGRPFFGDPTFLSRPFGGIMNQSLMRRVQVGGLLLGSVIVLTAADTTTLPAPPVAKKVPHVTEVNGHKMVDDYYLAAGQAESRGAGLSGGRERLHRGGDEADGSVSEKAVWRDAGTHQGDRCRGTVSRG